MRIPLTPHSVGVATSLVSASKRTAGLASPGTPTRKPPRRCSPAISCLVAIIGMLASTSVEAGALPGCQADTFVGGSNVSGGDPANGTSDCLVNVPGLPSYVTFSAYDSQGNVTSVTDPHGAVMRYQYDPVGRVATITDTTGTTTESYDSAGRLITSTEGSNVTKYTYYDPAGNAVRTITDPAGNVTTYTYYDAGHTVIMTIEEDDSSHHPIVKYQYDPTGRLVSSTDSSGMTSYTYSMGQLTDAIDPSSNDTKFAYDAVGNLLSITDASGNVTRFAYDFADRIVKVTDPDGTTTTITYAPEPSSLMMIASGLAALAGIAAFRRRGRMHPLRT